VNRLARRRLADVRVPLAAPAALLMGAVFVAVMLYRARRFMFFSDEWDFILESPRWRPLDYLSPHNEHWSTVPRLYYQLVEAAGGVHSYVPYEAGVLVADAACAVLLFLIIRRRAGDLVGLLVAALLLGLGRGWEDVLWAFQLGFVGATAMGLLAIYLLDTPVPGRSRLLLASGVLVGSLLFSGIALFFLLLVLVELGLDSKRRRYLVVLIAPVLVYAAWYLRFGRDGTTHDRITIQGLLPLAGYVPHGAGSAAAGLLGLSPAWSAAALAGLAAAAGAALALARGRDSRLIAAAVALIAQYTFTGLVRAQFGIDQAAASRYIFVGAVFVLLLLGQAVRYLPAGRIPALAVLLVVVLGLGNSLRFFNSQVVAWDLAAAQQVAAMQETADLQGAPDLDLQALFIPSRMPDVSAGRYYDGVRRVVSAVPSAGLADIRARQPVVFDQVLLALFAKAIRVEPAAAATAATDRGRCLPIDPTAGYVDLSVPSGGTIGVSSEVNSAPLLVYLWSAAGPEGSPTATLLLPPGQSAIHLPDAGGQVTWQGRLVGPPYVSVCSSGR